MLIYLKEFKEETFLKLRWNIIAIYLSLFNILMSESKVKNNAYNYQNECTIPYLN